MDNNEVMIVSATLSSQGPTGPQGPKGDPGYMVFEIKNGCLILNGNTKEMTFEIENKCLVMEVN